MNKFFLTLFGFVFISSLFAQVSSDKQITHTFSSNAIPLLLDPNSSFSADNLSEFVVPDISFADHNSSVHTKNRILLRSNNRFEIWGLVSEDAAADTVIKVLSNNFNRVADSLDTTFTHKIIVDIYPDLASYHAAIGWPNAPDWVVGNASGNDKIDMVSPYNPGPAHNFSSMINVVKHEMVHNFVHFLTNGSGVPIWINEGTATFLAYQTASVNAVCSYVNQNGGNIPSLTDLNVFSTFGNIGGYTFSYTIAEFIASELGGSSVLSQFMASGMDYSVLGFTNQQTFQDEWNQFLYVNYPCNNYNGLHAAFTADVETGPRPLAVSFSDFSTHGGTTITSWSWDFDSDGTIDSYSQNPVYTYNTMGTYTVSLTVTNGTDVSTYTRDNYIEVLQSNVNVAEHSTGNIGVSIYPNPAQNHLNIEKEGVFLLSIYNLFGQKLLHMSCENREMVDLGEFESGVYLVMVSTKGNTVTQRLIIH